MSRRPIPYWVKDGLGRLPGAAAAYQRWLADGRAPTGGYRLDRLAEHLPGWIEAARRARPEAPGLEASPVLIVGSLPWWIEHAVSMGLLMLADGHAVDLAYLPYHRWVDPVSRFDLQRQQTYLRDALAPLRDIMGLVDLSAGGIEPISTELETSIRAQAELDVQYSLQREGLDYSQDAEARLLLKLRLERDRKAAGAMLRLLCSKTYASVVIPNGSILEFGAVYRVARARGCRVVTYEFGEQRRRVWLAQDDEVMRLRTTELWRARGDVPLEPDELQALSDLYQARRGGQRWAHFARQWQAGGSQGAQAVRQQLGLPADKKLVLICTNVVGDSLALDRQIFTQGMADWLVRAVDHVAQSQDAVVVVRVHPGELQGAGHPSREILHNSLPDLADQVILIPPESDINTYDLIDLAHLGLVYTTTVGMEMAMRGVPVVVAGDTHYRGKGFSDDPESLASFFQIIDQRLAEPDRRRVPDSQVELAVRYAYRFFFEYPFEYPWHIVSFWDDMAEQPLEVVVQAEARQAFHRTFLALAGAPIDWRADVQVGAGVPA